jgi:hypothetical protein
VFSKSLGRLGRDLARFGTFFEATG